MVQQEEEGDEVGLREGEQQVEHAALFGHAVGECCEGNGGIRVPSDVLIIILIMILMGSWDLLPH